MTAKKKPAATKPVITGDFHDFVVAARDATNAKLAGAKRTATRRPRPKLLPVDPGHEEVALVKMTHRASPPVEPLQFGYVISADDQARMSSLEAQVIALQGKLKVAEAESKDDNAEILRVTGQMQDLNGLLKTATEINKQQEADLTAARTTIENLVAAASSATTKEATMRADFAEILATAEKRSDALQNMVAARNKTIGTMRSEGDAAEERIDALKTALAEAQRGWIARLFRRPAAGRA